MTQVWDGDECISVTIVEALPCKVVQIKNVEKDGYESLQIGSGEKKEKNIKKPQIGHLKKAGILSNDMRVNLRHLREFRVDGEKISEKVNVGDVINVGAFELGDIVDVIGTSKGKGFQGVVKRYGFKGAPKTHGTKDQVRMPGSIGATGPARVFKGMRMGGRMGDERVTTKNLKVVKVDIENNQLYIRGAVPGARNGFVMIRGEGDLKVVANEVKSVDVSDIKEEVAEKS